MKKKINSDQLNPAKQKSREVILASGHKCFDECRPIKQKFNRLRSGLDRPSCVDCFERNAGIDIQLEIHLPGISSPVLRGSKCHGQCMPKKGDYQAAHQSSVPLDCKICLGLEGFAAEEFTYIQTQSGACFEADHVNFLRQVPEKLCQRDDVLLTKFNRESASFISKFVFGPDAGQCLEIDEKTLGSKYKAIVESEFCRNESQNNLERKIRSSKNTLYQ